ncbi:MAG: acyl carrier protein [Patescibacteria group bacterium]|nr:acyl carrier protein [Patescibacteria group bacterium]
MPRQGTVEERARQVIAGQLDTSSERVGPGMRLIEDLRAGPDDVPDLAAALNEEFKVEIPEGEVECFRTVQQVIDRVKRELGKREPAGQAV